MRKTEEFSLGHVVQKNTNTKCGLFWCWLFSFFCLFWFCLGFLLETNKWSGLLVSRLIFGIS